MNTPTVGRIVHYRYPSDAKCYAAIVIDVYAPDDPEVYLYVLHPMSGPYYALALPCHMSESRPGWHWPERAPEPPTVTDG